MKMRVALLMLDKTDLKTKFVTRNKRTFYNDKSVDS